MLEILRTIFLLVTVFAGTGIARKGCRQCVGAHTLSFQNRVYFEDLKPFVDLSLKGCATGNQYQIDGVTATLDCDPNTTKYHCKVWHLNVMVWRYCGNGALANRNNGPTCINGACSVTNSLSLACDPSVYCIGTCNAEDCE